MTHALEGLVGPTPDGWEKVAAVVEAKLQDAIVEAGVDLSRLHAPPIPPAASACFDVEIHGVYRWLCFYRMFPLEGAPGWVVQVATVAD